jgi:dolichol-phosphate mannosyltransferase
VKWSVAARLIGFAFRPLLRSNCIRALTARHSFHILPGESILELGAGSGLWTEDLTDVLQEQNPITGVVFNRNLVRPSTRHSIKFLHIENLTGDLQLVGSFDYIVGPAILRHDRYEQNLRALYRLLKPGDRG